MMNSNSVKYLESKIDRCEAIISHLAEKLGHGLRAGKSGWVSEKHVEEMSGDRFEEVIRQLEHDECYVDCDAFYYREGSDCMRIETLRLYDPEAVRDYLSD